jgi:uncharacterized protein YihD (DUF1040 family)
MLDGIDIQSNKATEAIQTLVDSATWHKRQYLVLHRVLQQLVEESDNKKELKSRIDAMELAHLRDLKQSEKTL